MKTETSTGMQASAAEQVDAHACSEPFVGRWQRLVSMTNWEKGRIICEWRDALVAAGMSAAEYSDEAWSRRISGVSSQHVGRLRRVYRRFAAVHGEYAGLYWSHFNAALDWHDAEMWLEGAVQSGWSISQLKSERRKAVGGIEGVSDVDLVIDPDEHTGEDGQWQPPARAVPTDPVAVREPGSSGAPADIQGETKGKDRRRDGEKKEKSASDRHHAGSAPAAESTSSATAAPGRGQRPFAGIGPLPSDLADAMDALKLAILHHKMDGWREVARERVLKVLDALKEVALAESSE